MGLWQLIPAELQKGLAILAGVMLALVAQFAGRRIGAGLRAGVNEVRKIEADLFQRVDILETRLGEVEALLTKKAP